MFNSIVEEKSKRSHSVISWREDNARAESHWYAIHTCSRREKQVARLCGECEITHFLPLYQRKPKRYSADACHLLPLFPGYVLVRVIRGECRRVLQIPGVVRFVSFKGKPAEIPDEEIGAVRFVVERALTVQPHSYFKAGQLVEIQQGALRGTRGKVLRMNKRFRVVLSIDALGRSIVAEVDEEDLEVESPARLQSVAA